MEFDEKVKVPLFDGTNSDNWKFRMLTLLEELELEEFVERDFTN